MSTSSGAIRATARGPTASCAGSAPRGGARAAPWKSQMAIDFPPTLAYPRPQRWPPTLGGPFLFELLTRFRENRDEAHLSTEPPRAQDRKSTRLNSSH